MIMICRYNQSLKQNQLGRKEQWQENLKLKNPVAENFDSI
jgi:hypothetical protein